MVRFCHAFLSVLCSLVFTCFERAGLLAPLCVMFSSAVVTFPCGVLGQVWYFIALMSNICILSYFDIKDTKVTIAKCYKIHVVTLYVL